MSKYFGVISYGKFRSICCEGDDYSVVHYKVKLCFESHYRSFVLRKSKTKRPGMKPSYTILEQAKILYY